MKLTKRHILNYMIDCLGYREEDAKLEIAVYSLKQLFSSHQLKECILFNK